MGNDVKMQKYCRNNLNKFLNKMEITNLTVNHFKND